MPFNELPTMYAVFVALVHCGHMMQNVNDEGIKSILINSVSLDVTNFPPRMGPSQHTKVKSEINIRTQPAFIKHQNNILWPGIKL